MQFDKPGEELWPTDRSRDGRFILYSRGDLLSLTRGEISVLPVAGDRKARVLHSAGPAYDGHFSPDWALGAVRIERVRPGGSIRGPV